MRFLEDNQAMLQCVKSGRNPTMRHLARTHRVSVGWIHEQYMSGQFIFAHESGERMPPDIFTKMFSDKSKWVTARLLINVVLPEELTQVMEQSKELFEGIQERPALPVKAKKRKRRLGSAAVPGSTATLNKTDPPPNGGPFLASDSEGGTETFPELPLEGWKVAGEGSIGFDEKLGDAGTPALLRKPRCNPRPDFAAAPAPPECIPG